mmetsp:Transcript_157735/g.382994  ORF Transcript_157735/g.382994 Transcript_157735/m.382994 type:complete len:303 (-) Transcript_157735:48-956(-)
MDGPLALHAQGRASQALGPVALRVVDAAEGAVDGAEAVGAGGDHDARHCVVPRVVPEEVTRLVAILVSQHAVVGVGSTDVRRPALGGGGVVRDTKVQGLVALGGGRNLVAVHHAHGRLDDEAKAKALLAAHEALHLAHQGVRHVDVLRVAHHGDDEHVAPLACLLDDVDHVAVHVVTVEAVDADSHGLVAKVHLLQGLDDVRTGGCLLAFGHGVLQVHDNDVGIGLGSLGDELRVGTWHVQLAAVQAWPGLLHDRETGPAAPDAALTQRCRCGPAAEEGGGSAHGLAARAGTGEHCHGWANN